MNLVARDAFARVNKEDYRDDPTLSVYGLSELWPVQTMLDMESALAVGTLGDLFPGREINAIDYFTTANDAPMTPRELPAETPADDELCEPEQVFESGHIFQSDIQRAAAEFQRFAERFHAFASECQQRVTV
jgi:hypothetical protein